MYNLIRIRYGSILFTDGLGEALDLNETSKALCKISALVVAFCLRLLSGLVDNESKKNTAAVGKLDEELKGYIQAMKQRDIYRYDTGRDQALQSLKTVQEEITDFQV